MEEITIYRPLKAIRLKCLDCCAGSRLEVTLCACTDCTLYPYRFGHRPVGKEKPERTDSAETVTLDEGLGDEELEW